MIEIIEKNREDLEALAKRDDLQCSRYAKALLRTAGSEPSAAGEGAK